MYNKNKMVCRHLLATKPQMLSGSFGGFYQVLMKISKDSSFSYVLANQYRAELIRNAFTGVIRSMDIRQRTLINNIWTLEQAYEQARVLDVTEQDAKYYDTEASLPF